MDEPFGAVDAIVRASLQDEIARIHRELGTTIVFVTHDVDEALRLADRVVVMNAGRDRAGRRRRALLAAPADDDRALAGRRRCRDRAGFALERPLIER
jgi:osmoprotectant transport system ATP-binding protein